MYIYICVFVCVHHILCGWSVYYQKLKGIESSFEAALEGQTTPYETIKKGTHHLPFLLVPSAQDAAMLNVERMAELSAVEAIVLGVHQIFVKRNWYSIQ